LQVKGYESKTETFINANKQNLGTAAWMFHLGKMRNLIFNGKIHASNIRHSFIVMILLQKGICFFKAIRDIFIGSLHSLTK